ncbi:MAG: fluoride efflux transporter CrcB [Bacteroidetes bacterium]|nr:fluoride efflux transporter CrcB [Bacteroidota bacterium]MBS1931311.1 fluoride efflux transporter CrcB [Bacteroidota bacterium]
MKNILLIGLGGGIGSIARYFCQKWVAENIQHPFPWGTFAVNVAGCFLIGIIYAIAERTTVLAPQIRLLLITGFCGGFTTFSTFAFENMNLLRNGDMTYMLLYTLASVVLGIAAVFAGIGLIKIL